MTTDTKTVREIVVSALRKSGILGFGENPPSEDAEAAMGELDLMLKSWQNKSFSLWTKTSMSLTLTTQAEHTLSPVRPLRILSARLKRSGVETPMYEMTRDEYDNIPVKLSQGLPTQFHYDRQREAARFYVWPVLSAVNGETVEITYDREVDDISSLSQQIDVPTEWWDATVYGLAARLIETVPFSGQSHLVMQRAEMLLSEALAFDREGSVYFAGEGAE